MCIIIIRKRKTSTGHTIRIGTTVIMNKQQTTNVKAKLSFFNADAHGMYSAQIASKSPSQHCNIIVVDYFGNVRLVAKCDGEDARIYATTFIDCCSNEPVMISEYLKKAGLVK